MPQKKRNGRLSKEDVAKREKWVLDQFKKHPEWTKEDLNKALVAQDKLGGIPMRPVRVYELKRAAAAGTEEVPAVVAGKRPSKRIQPTQARATEAPAPTTAQRRSAPTQGQEQQAVQQATNILQKAGFEEIQISYRPAMRTVTVG